MNAEFNFAKAEEKAKEGIDLAYNNSCALWRVEANGAILRVMEKGRAFTADDISKEMKRSGVTFEPRELRAMGGVLRTAAQCGLIERVGYGKTERVSSHGGLRTLWSKKK